MSEIIKKYILEIFLFILIAITILVRSLKSSKYLDDSRPFTIKIIDILGSIAIGCSVGIAVFIGTLYFTGDSNSYLGFLLGYLLGSLGEKILNILDVKFSDILTEFFQVLSDRISGGK